MIPKRKKITQEAHGFENKIKNTTSNNSEKNPSNSIPSDKMILKNSSLQKNSFFANSTNKILGKNAPTFKLNKNSITQNQSNPKNKPNPNIDYLKIPIVKDPDILGKILENPQKKLLIKLMRQIKQEECIT